jgi:hypothetical protein
MTRRLLVVAALLTLPAQVQAQQPVANPTVVEFDSPSHESLDGNNQPILVEYEVLFIEPGATAPRVTATVPRAGVELVSPGRYRIPFSSLPAYPVGVVFNLAMTARGPAGTSARSALAPESFTRPVPVPETVTNVNVR